MSCETCTCGRCKPGLVTCDACGQTVAPRDDHYSVHFADLRAKAPCPRSYPPALKLKAEAPKP